MALRKQKSGDNEVTQEVTVLKRFGAWEQREITQLVCNLRVATERYPDHPMFLIIRGKFDSKRVQTALGGKIDFQHQIMAVSESKKKLPFEILPR